MLFVSILGPIRVNGLAAREGHTELRHHAVDTRFRNQEHTNTHPNLGGMLESGVGRSRCIGVKDLLAAEYCSASRGLRHLAA